jgi:hypothetical protein
MYPVFRARIKRDGDAGTFIADPVMFYCNSLGYWLFELVMFPFLGPSSISFTEFVSEGWRRECGEVPRTENVLKVRELELEPVLKRNSSEVRLFQHRRTQVR